jgi:predicted negative regulator of RcsB-dependent stress response
MKPKIYCPYCNAELRWGDKFCGNCGKQIEWSDAEQPQPGEAQESSPQSDQVDLTCPSCGTVNKPGSERCKTCGSDLRIHSRPVTAASSAAPKQGKREVRSTKKELKTPSFLNSWKPAVALVVVIVAAVLIQNYVEKANVSAQAPQEQTTVPQQPATANMAAIPQIQQMEQQVKANPADLGLTLQLANFLSDNRFYDKAISYYQAYLKKKPKDTNARVDMGICYKEIGEYDTAMQEMKQALKYDPTHLFATFNLGIVALDKGKMYMDQGQMDKANELIKESNDWFKKTVALAPTSEVGKRAQQLLSQHSSTQLPSSN